MDRLVLTGLEGVVEGERFDVDWGQTVVLGRSRTCDISLRRCPKFQALSPEVRDTDKGLLTVSRRHARLSFPDRSTLLIEDLSANGTFVDGERVICCYLTDLRTKPHELRLGKRERMRVEVATDSVSALSTPPPTLSA